MSQGRKPSRHGISLSKLHLARISHRVRVWIPCTRCRGHGANQMQSGTIFDKRVTRLGMVGKENPFFFFLEWQWNGFAATASTSSDRASVNLLRVKMWWSLPNVLLYVIALLPFSMYAYRYQTTHVNILRITGGQCKHLLVRPLL